MKYISNDGKIFNTEQECCEYERHIERQKVEREKLVKERKDRLDTIIKSMKSYKSYFLNMRKIMV